MNNKPVKKSAQRRRPKTKDPNYLKSSEVPRSFMDETGYTLADYSVALGYSGNAKDSKLQIFGSGVLVHKGNRFGVLTAHHCADNSDADFQFGSFGGNRLVLVLKHRFIKLPPEVLIKHSLGIPKGAEMEPDLAFVEILPSPQLDSIKAISSFWSLDKDSFDIQQAFGGTGMPFTVVGFPGEYHQPPKSDGRTIRVRIKHMTYFYAIAPDSISTRGGWDYIEAQNWYGKNNDLPNSFEGVSGGPVWGLQIKRDKVTGQLILKKFSLIGIAFLQVRLSKKKLRVRAHFIKSIYDIAWRNMS